MALKTCTNGHQFEKTSDCPVCPICSAAEMKATFGNDFPKIGAPALRALDQIGVSTLSDLTKYSEAELLALHGFGPRALRILRDAMAKQNLSFAEEPRESV